jgi:hypothetical protein
MSWILPDFSVVPVTKSPTRTITKLTDDCEVERENPRKTRVNLKNKRWRAKNKDKVKAQNERAAARKAKWQRANLKRILEKRRERYRKDPKYRERVLAQNRLRDRLRRMVREQTLAPGLQGHSVGCVPSGSNPRREAEGLRVDAKDGRGIRQERG